MGTLYYDSTSGIDIEDRVLAHLQVVIVAKLRRNEPLLLSWRDDRSAGDGSSAIWLHPALSLRFTYFGGRAPRINPAWVADLTALANSPGGLHVTAEPAEPVRPPSR